MILRDRSWLVSATCVLLFFVLGCEQKTSNVSDSMSGSDGGYINLFSTDDCDADFEVSLSPWPPVSNNSSTIKTGGVLDDGCFSQESQSVRYQIVHSSGSSDWIAMQKIVDPEDDVIEFVAEAKLPSGSVSIRFEVIGYSRQALRPEEWKLSVK